MKWRLFIMTFLMASSVVWGKEYNLDLVKDVDLESIENLVIEVDTYSCIGCIDIMDIDSIIKGVDSEKLKLSLNGTVYSNRSLGVPALYARKRGKDLVISLYPENKTMFVTFLRGVVTFQVQVPDWYKGNVEIRSSSRNLDFRSLAVGDLYVKASSGRIFGSDIKAETINVVSSSGGIEVENMKSKGRMVLKSSSGKIYMSNLESGGELSATVSSGGISSKKVSGDIISMKSQSGRIEMESVTSQLSSSIRTSSGRIDIDKLKGTTNFLKSSSGRITVSDLEGGLDLNNSSGGATVSTGDILGDIRMISSSGRLKLEIPEGESYSVRLNSSSGKITCDDKITGVLNQDRERITGDVRDGGPVVEMDTSSGNITISHR